MRAFEFKPKKIEFGRLPVKPTGIPVRTVCTEDFKFKFDFHRFGRLNRSGIPVPDPAGLAGPISNVDPAFHTYETTS